MAQVTKTVSAGHAGIAPFNLSGTDYYDVSFIDDAGGKQDVVNIQAYSDGTGGDAWVTTDLTVTTVPTAGTTTACLCLPTGIFSTVDVKLDGTLDTVRILSSGTPRVGIQKV